MNDYVGIPVSHVDQSKWRGAQSGRQTIGNSDNLSDLGSRAQQTPTPDVVGIAPELVERMEALVRAMAAPRWNLADNENYQEARAIVSLLPEPVDGLERLINIAMNSGDTAKEIAETIRSSPDVWGFITAKAS